EPCPPSPAKAPPSGPGWLHEIKHDGFRFMARRDGAGVRLTTRNGNDFTSRFPPNSRHSADTSLSVHPRPCVSYLSGQMTCRKRRTQQSRQRVAVASPINTIRGRHSSELSNRVCETNTNAPHVVPSLTCQ